MNKQRRAKIERALDILKDVLDEEQDVFDNMPENLQGSDRGIESEEAIDTLDEVIGELEELV